MLSIFSSLTRRIAGVDRSGSACRADSGRKRYDEFQFLFFNLKNAIGFFWVPWKKFQGRKRFQGAL
jgi:hypothetical protein